MKLSDLKRRLRGYYVAGASIYVRSMPGRGKTTTIVAAVPELSKQLGKNLGIVVINGGLLNPPDAIGYLTMQKVGDHVESVFSSPFWFRTDEGKPLSAYDGGIIFVDEADKMEVEVKKCIGEAALSGRLGPHILPPGWVVWFAGNRAQDRSGSTKELDHLINRQKIIEVTDDMDSLLEWADDTDQCPEFKAFVATNPEIVLASALPKEQGPWCTPRSLALAFKDLEPFRTPDGKLPTDPLAQEDVAGRIGAGAATQLFNMIRLGMEMPPYEEIVAKPDEVKVPSRPDAQMLVVYNLAARVGPKDSAPIIQYLERFPKEFAVTFAKSACKRDMTLVSAPPFQKWIAKNGSLLTAITDARAA
jgi:hypothetical protein